MNVVMIVPRFPPAYGGAGLQAERLAQGLCARGVRVTVLTTRASGRGDTQRAPYQPAARRALRVHAFPAPETPRGLDLALGAQAAAWLLGHGGWDVLHLHTGGLFAVLPVQVAKLRRRPVILKTSLLGGDDLAKASAGRLGRVLLATYRRADRIIALSDEIERSLRADARIAPHVLRIPNGVDLATFRPAGAELRESRRREHGLPRDALVLLATHRLSARKGVVGLLEAVAGLRTRPLSLVLAGPDEPASRAALENGIARLPSDVQLRRLGAVPPDTIAELMQAADVFCLNSGAEGLPNALLEAMASGLPSVVRDIPGTRDALPDAAGIRVPPDAAAFGRALDALAGDPARRAALGLAAREHVERHFDLADVVRRYEQLYTELAGSRS